MEQALGSKGSHVLKRDLPVHFRATLRALLRVGRTVGPFMPWHHSADAYNWLVAESLLRRTTRTAAQKAYSALIAKYPRWDALNSATHEEIIELIGWVGLGNQRAKHLKALAGAMVNHQASEAMCERSRLLRLPGVGDYIADAVLLYVCHERRFPIDPNIQRVFRRVIGLPTAIGTRHSVPYDDPWLARVSEHLSRYYTAEKLIDIHRGVLYVAWTTCRPRTDCPACPLQRHCVVGQATIGSGLLQSAAKRS